MLTQFSRTELLLGKEAMDRLSHSRVAVFGIGGVGGYVCEALVRSGVGHFDLVDDVILSDDDNMSRVSSDYVRKLFKNHDIDLEIDDITKLESY